MAFKPNDTHTIKKFNRDGQSAASKAYAAMRRSRFLVECLEFQEECIGYEED
jgi:hypothetical protein